MKVDANGNPIVEDDNTQPEDKKGGEDKPETKPEAKPEEKKAPAVKDDEPQMPGRTDDPEKKPEDDAEAKKAALKAEILKELGISEDQVEKLKKISGVVFGKEEKKDEKSSDEKFADLEKRTELAELKADLMQYGVASKYIDDAVVLVAARKNKDSQFTLKDSISEFKSKYPEWFQLDNGKKFTGTGSSVKGKSSGADNKDDKGLGARLAALKKPSTGKKSSYWGSR